MRRRTDAEKLDALSKQYKQKNKYIAANYDRIGIVAPKGTRDYIKSLGMSANSYINGLIEADRKRREAAEADLQQEPHEATQAAKAAPRTNTHEANESRTEGRTEAQEGTTTAGTKEGRTRGRSRKGSGDTTGGPEEGNTAGSSNTARREPVDAADTGTKATPGDNLQQYFNPYKYNSDNLLLYPYDTDDIPPEELPFH